MRTPQASRSRYRPFVPPPPPKTPKAAETRRLLIEVAAGLFIERGFSAVSMRDVASEANLTQGALYGHFRSKGQLLVEVIRWKLAAQEHSRPYTDLVVDPERAVELLYHPSGRAARLLQVDAYAAARHDPEVAAGITDLYLERHDRIRDAVSELADPDTATWFITTLSAGLGTKESTGLPSPDPDRLRSIFMSALEALS